MRAKQEAGATKRCFKCDVLHPLSEFYKHPQMADGHLNKCKSCTKKDVQERYAITREDRAAYDIERNKRPERKEAQARYTKTKREKNPEKYRAHTAVGNAIRDGRLKRLPCEVCGEVKAEAHHDDYSKPLDVRWLCFRHHREDAHDQVVTAKTFTSVKVK